MYEKIERFTEMVDLPENIFPFFPTKLLSFQTILFYFLKNFAELGQNLRQFWRILSFSLFVIEF